MDTLKISAELSSLSEVMEYIESELREKKIKNKYILETLLLSEESIVQLIDNSAGGDLHVTVKKGFPMTKIKLSAHGNEFIPDAQDISLCESSGDRESEMAIRSLVFQNYASRIKYINKHGVNYMEIAVGMPERALTFLTAGVFMASLIIGILMKFLLSDGTCEFLNEYVLMPVMTLFLNALKLTVAPMMFLSIITNFSKYTSFSDMGKAGISTVLSFFVSSAVAVLFGMFSYKILDPGIAGELAVFDSFQGGGMQMGAGKYPDILTSIIPDNIITPFLEMNSVQLIFFALVCGIALGNAGRYSKSLQSSAQALSTVCETVASMFNKAMPVVVFFATVALVLNTELHTILSLAQMYASLILALLFMIVFHIVSITLLGRTNPFAVIKKYLGTLKKTFFLGSSIAAIPDNIKLCRNKLGIDDRICSFTIPFGAMANMDGNCIYLTVASLFIARICGVEVMGSAFLPFMLSVMILSVGAPIASGSVLICMSMLFSQLGISISAITLLLGLNSIVEMVLAVFDSFGDIAVSIIIASKYRKTKEKETENADIKQSGR